MNPTNKRWLIRLAVLLLAGLAALFWSVGKLGRELTIENRSEQEIAELKITIAGQVTTFANVKPGGEVSVPGPESGEGQFLVQGKFADGNMFRVQGHIRDNLHFWLLPGGQLQPRPKRWFG